MASSDPKVSHGRGGRGNIKPDATKYVDGSVFREGIHGESVDGDYLSGRGGSGNIVASPRVEPSRRQSLDKIPDVNMRARAQPSQGYHTGRGGEGNIVSEEKHEQQESPPQSILDRAKQALGLEKNKKADPAS